MSAKPMTVLQVLPSLESGGAERTTVQIAAALIGEGHRALVVSEGGRMVDELAALGVRHIELPVASKRIHTLRSNAARLADLLELEEVDIVHARSRAPAWSALWAASWTYRPLVTTYHGAYGERSIFKNRYNSVMARGDAVIANSAYIANLVAERHPFAEKRIVTIHRGVDLGTFEGDASGRATALRRRWRVEDGTPIILHLARLTRWKGQEVLIDALARLDRLAPQPWVAVFAGDDQGRHEYRRGLMDKAITLGLEDRVRVADHVDDVPGAFAAATLAVQPSLEPEAFGRVAVEAQAAGVPVIVSDHGAVRETVLAPPDVAEAKRTGWRVAPGEVEPLAEALAEALKAPDETRAVIGERGRAHAWTHFSVQSMQQKTLRVYQSLLEAAETALY